MIPRTLVFFSTGAALANLPFLIGFPLFLALMSILAGNIILGWLSPRNRAWEDYKRENL